MTLGEKLAELREDLNLSQKEVAERLNIARSTMQAMKLGQHNLPILS